MSDTPRTDAALQTAFDGQDNVILSEVRNVTDLARTLERELSESLAYAEQMQAVLKLCEAWFLAEEPDESLDAIVAKDEAWKASGKPRGYNTDYMAAIRALRAALAKNPPSSFHVSPKEK